MEIGKTLKLLNEIMASPLFRTSEAVKDLEKEVKDIAKAQADRDQAVKEKAALQKENDELRSEQKGLKEGVGKLQKAHKVKEEELRLNYEALKEGSEKLSAKFLDEENAKSERAIAALEVKVHDRAKEVDELEKEVKAKKEEIRQLADLKVTVQTEIDNLKAGLDQLRQQHFGG